MGIEKQIFVNKIIEEQEKPSLTYRLGMETSRIAGRVDELAAVEQFIEKTLLTPRNKCLIYDEKCGCDVRDLLAAGDASPEYIAAELPRMVESALLRDSRVIEVRDFDFEFEDDSARIAFAVTTIFGETSMEVVV